MTARSIGRIFVLIPAYRDRDCPNTVRDLITKARWPEALAIGILWQLDPERDQDCLAGMPDHAGIRAITHPSRTARGCSWARHEAMQLWQGEEFALQIDAHTRVVQDWDARMLDQLARCGAARPLLTTRPLHFDLPDRTATPAHALTTAERFDSDGVLHFGGGIAPLAAAPPMPAPTAFAAGGFIFGPAQRILDVPFDPHVYFSGEEANLSVRLWTAGWDLFLPSETLLFHHYAQAAGRLTPWQDHPHWQALQVRSVLRQLHLLGIAPAADPVAIADLDRYGLGAARSLARYERFAGVDFTHQRIADHALRGEPDLAAPN
jgi:hypothetical protein